MFLGSGGRNGSNSHQLGSNRREKIFMNAIKNMCKNLGMKPSWAQKAEMSLAATSLFQQAG